MRKLCVRNSKFLLLCSWKFHFVHSKYFVRVKISIMCASSSVWGHSTWNHTARYTLFLFEIVKNRVDYFIFVQFLFLSAVDEHYSEKNKNIIIIIITIISITVNLRFFLSMNFLKRTRRKMEIRLIVSWHGNRRCAHKRCTPSNVYYDDPSSSTIEICDGP
jgi:hypothetical protein